MPSVDFYIDEERIMQLDDIHMKVTGDTRHEIMPRTRDISEEIPGRHGEIDFGTELSPGYLELRLAVELQGKTKDYIKRVIAKHFNPVAGIKKLMFADDPNKIYKVKYSGRFSHREYPSWVEMTVPLKIPGVFIVSAEKEESFIGTKIISVDGNVETSMIVLLDGAVSSPQVTVSSVLGEKSFEWKGSIAESKQLVVNTGKETVVYDGENALDSFEGHFPQLYPGDNLVSASLGGVVKWEDKWI